MAETFVKPAMKCADCGTDDDHHWYCYASQWYCHACADQHRPAPISHAPGKYERDLQNKLPKNHVLGPKMPGMDGMRGVFEIKKRR